MKNVLVVAPHPDDETLGCGGTLLRHAAEGDRIHWLVVTQMSEALGFSRELVSRRERELDDVARHYGFASRHILGLPPARLDTVPLVEFISKIGAVIEATLPEVLYVPYSADAHSDHAVVAAAVSACSKWFRYGSIKRVLAYETLSETDFGLSPDRIGFHPTVFVDVSNHLEKKLEIMRTYAGELGVFPFPRSEEAIRSLAAVRGARAGFRAAESFILLKEVL